MKASASLTSSERPSSLILTGGLDLCRGGAASLVRLYPELNPAENIWRRPRDNWLSNRVFKP